MPTRARLDEFIAAVVSGDHAGAIERYYTEDASMQENAAAPRVGRDALVAGEPPSANAEEATLRLSNAKPVAEFVAGFPISDASKSQLIALYDGVRDPLAGRSVEEKLAVLKRISYRDFLTKISSCGEDVGIRCSLMISATIRSGDDRKPPIGPHSQVQNASPINTASALRASRRPMMVGVTKWPSMNAMPTSASGAITPAPMVGNAMMPTAASTRNIATGPMIGMKFNVAASANLPSLVMLLFWKRTSKHGITASIFVGLFSSLAWVLMSDEAYKNIYGADPTKALVPFSQPALVTLPLAFVVLIVVSLLTPPPEETLGMTPIVLPPSESPSRPSPPELEML